MKARDSLARHLAELTEQVGVEGQVIECNGRLYVLLTEVALPPGTFLLETTDVLFITDHQYPLSAPDMFWTDPEVVLPGGELPRGAEWTEEYLGREWRRFSWHRRGAWRPAGNTLLDHFALMEERFAVESRDREAA